MMTRFQEPAVQRHSAEEDLRARLNAREQELAALRRSLDELTDFVENASLGLHWVGPDGTILWANDAELSMLGYARDEYIGRHIAEFHADRPVIEDILTRLTCKETLRNYQARLRCKDGSVRYVLINSNVFWQDGQFIHTRCFTRDVTELKLAEQEREASLAQAQQAREEAEAAVRAREEFLQVAAHELRTPVTAILGTAQVALRARQRETLTPERAERAFRSIAQTAKRLGQLTSDLLDVSRLRGGQLALRLEPLDLTGLVRSALERWTDLLDPSHLLEASLPAHPLPVQGDPGRLEQILDNLLSNAVKYSPAGGTIEVTLTAEAGGAVIRVKDPGIGLPEGAAELIFEPFGRAPNAAERHLPGLGLGLYISRQIIERHGGRIRAESRGEGLGTTVWVRLPAKGPHEPG